MRFTIYNPRFTNPEDRQDSLRQSSTVNRQSIPERVRSRRKEIRLPRIDQLGYLLEIPLILFGVLILISLVGPHLPLWAVKPVVTLAAFPVLFCLYYMIVIPGWQPDRPRLPQPFRLGLFLTFAILIMTGLIWWWL